MMGRAAGRFVKAGKHAEAARTLTKSISLLHQSKRGPLAGRSILGLILVHLHLGDPVAAKKAFQGWGGYCDADQTQAGHWIVDGFNDNDAGKE